MPGQVTCVVVTPERTALEKVVDFVALPLYDGEIGISHGHTPLIGRLGYGELRLKVDGQVERYYVDGGFVQVADNVVSLLTEAAVAVKDLDRAAAERQLAAAQAESPNTAEGFQIRDRNLSQARAKLRVGRG